MDRRLIGQKMHQLKKITAITFAAALVSTPVHAQQQRKTLLEVLFPKAHERQVKRNRLLREQQLAERKAVRVPKTRYYTYEVAPRAKINIKPVLLEYAALEDGASNDHPTLDDGTAKPLGTMGHNQMVHDIGLAKDLVVTAETHLAKAISDHYSAEQGYTWLGDDGTWNARARSVMNVFAQADSLGLRPEHYSYMNFAPSTESSADQSVEMRDAKNRLVRELSLTIAALRYAMDAQFGTINPNKISGYHDFPVHDGKAGEMLDEISASRLPANTLMAFHPASETFLALRSELAALSRSSDDVIELPRDVLIRPGMINESLPLFIAAIKSRGSSALINKHNAVLDRYAGEATYTDEIVALVKGYQKEAGLGADGIIGPNTARKLAGLGSDEKRRKVILAMERLRWLPHEFGSRHVFINQPEYRARYMVGGEEELSMRVVVGTKANQTNFFYDEIERVVYNPYWGVPRSIIVNEFAVKSISDPAYLDARGYEITDGRGRRISSASIDWSQVGVYPKFDVRQPPGRANALGEVKILFPNKHSIYMHDTPSKHLFKRDARAFSHGCIRLQDPQGMAAAVLGKTKNHVASAIAKGKNATEELSSKVPVYVSYFTAWPQEDGTIGYFRDVYDRDQHLIKAMKATAAARSVDSAS